MNKHDELLARLGEPVAWRWDQVTYTELDVRGRSWEYNVFGTQKPNMPWMQRNVTPLYASPQHGYASEAELRKLVEDK